MIRHHNHFFRSFALASATLMFAMPAMADGPGFKPLIGMSYVPSVIKVSLLRQNDTTGEAYIHLSTPVAISGCPQVKPIDNTVDMDDPTLTITVTGYTVDFKNLSHAPQYGCKNSAQFATADIPLDRKLLEDNHINTIRFVLDKGAGSDTYEVHLDKNHLELLPKTDMIFEGGMMPYGGKQALSMWYYPENTLILTAPALPVGERDKAIADFATAHNLKPLETVMPDFVMPPGQEKRHYYVDSSGKTIAGVLKHDDVTLSDTIYARLPGSYE